jgi:hypothetical protein
LHHGFFKSQPFGSWGVRIGTHCASVQVHSKIGVTSLAGRPSLHLHSTWRANNSQRDIFFTSVATSSVGVHYAAASTVLIP